MITKKLYVLLRDKIIVYEYYTEDKRPAEVDVY